MPPDDQISIAILGLGYVGLPLAVAFAQHFPTLGFDISTERVRALRSGHDSTREISDAELRQAQSHGLEFTEDPVRLQRANVFIVTVPTPVTTHNTPDLEPLKRASELVGRSIPDQGIVIYESTVYPGATEEVCIPLIESTSGLVYNQGFYAGYSPERINPGDKVHRLSTVIKITSGSTPEAGDFVDQLYRRIITAGTHRMSSLAAAEAAKVIENTQRDVNIALVNELAILFGRLNLDTREILTAAGTKWNFAPFRPGLVGGHCIGVDPYYLTYKAVMAGFHPEMILAGRRINDGMGVYVAEQVLKLLVRSGATVAGSRILVLGLSFKEDCPDLRNTRVVDLVRELESYHAKVDVYDPWVEPAQARTDCQIELVDQPRNGLYSAIILAVAHQQFIELGANTIRSWGLPDAILYDVKGALPASAVDARL